MSPTFLVGQRGRPATGSANIGPKGAVPGGGIGPPTPGTGSAGKPDGALPPGCAAGPGVVGCRGPAAVPDPNGVACSPRVVGFANGGVPGSCGGVSWPKL